jgi:nudix-type nucleoside diphosphatase (YffH/AdpP family)
MAQPLRQGCQEQETAIAIITKLETLYSGWSRLFMATVEVTEDLTIRHEIEDHGEAAVVLAYDPERRCALLIRQLRTGALFAKADPMLLEVPAGLIDKGETPEEAACRETMEEVGLSVRTLEPMGAVFPMPAVSSERVHLFLAAYSAADRVALGGGVSAENERIEVLELSLADIWRRLQTREIVDLKTVTLVLMLRTAHPELFENQV